MKVDLQMKHRIRILNMILIKNHLRPDRFYEDVDEVAEELKDLFEYFCMARAGMLYRFIDKIKNIKQNILGRVPKRTEVHLVRALHDIELYCRNAFAAERYLECLHYFDEDYCKDQLYEFFEG